MYNFNHLYYFYITGKSGGVTRAAKHLRISQPSLSSQLKTLEGVLDLKLFRRVGRTNQLTRAGSAVYGFCQQMFEISEQMSEALTKRVPSATRRIHIGVSDEVERSFVVEVVSSFLKPQNPTTRPRVTIVAGTQSQLAERLKFRELDIIITELAMSDPDLVNLSRIESPIVLACPKKWKISSNFSVKTPAAIAEIAGRENSEWVMPSAKFKLRSEIDRFFEINELKGRTVLESDVLASLVRSVSDGLGMGFFPFLYVTKEPDLRILGPKIGYWKYRLWLVCNPQNREDPLIQAFSKVFRDVGTRTMISNRL